MLVTTTKSPLSMWGLYEALFLPLKTFDINAASLPTTILLASIIIESVLLNFIPFVDVILIVVKEYLELFIKIGARINPDIKNGVNTEVKIAEEPIGLYWREFVFNTVLEDGSNYIILKGLTNTLQIAKVTIQKL